MITTRAVPALLPAHHRRVATAPVSTRYDFADPLDRTLIWNQNHLGRTLRQYETHHNQHRPHLSLDGAALFKPLPEPADLEQYRVRREPRVGGTINEYRLVALAG